MIQQLRASGRLIRDTEDFQELRRRLESTKPSYDEFVKGKKALQQREYDRAYGHFRRAVELYPNNYEAMLYMALILSERKDYAGALELSSRAYRIMPDVFSTNYMMGFSMFNNARCKDAIGYLERAKSLIPSDPDTHYYLGRCYEEVGNTAKARESYTNAINLAQGRRPWVEDAKRRLPRL